MKHEKIPMSCREITDKILQIIQSTGKNILINEQKCIQFKSKKHYVIKTELFLIENSKKLKKPLEIVIKLFNDKILNYLEYWNNENNQYLKLKSLFGENNLPKLIFSTPGIVIYEYIHGINYFNLLMNRKLSNESLSFLSEWFYSLHKRGIVFGDSRLTNFILSKDNKLFVIDYEEIHRDDVVRDASNLMFSFIDNYPGILEHANIDYHLQQMFIFLKSYYSLIRDSPPYSLCNFSDNNDFISFWVEQLKKSLKMVVERRSLKINSEEINEMVGIIKKAFFQFFPKLF
ncbi:MAG: hypothetical protein ACTSWX_07035 [Promethearchaeota archaeon]